MLRFNLHKSPYRMAFRSFIGGNISSDHSTMQSRVTLFRPRVGSNNWSHRLSDNIHGWVEVGYWLTLLGILYRRMGVHVCAKVNYYASRSIEGQCKGLNPPRKTLTIRSWIFFFYKSLISFEAISIDLVVKFRCERLAIKHYPILCFIYFVAL